MYPDRGGLGICLIIDFKAGVLRGRPFTQPRFLPYTKYEIRYCHLQETNKTITSISSNLQIYISVRDTLNY